MSHSLSHATYVSSFNCDKHCICFDMPSWRCWLCGVWSLVSECVPSRSTHMLHVVHQRSRCRRLRWTSTWSRVTCIRRASTEWKERRQWWHGKAGVVPLDIVWFKPLCDVEVSRMIAPKFCIFWYGLSYWIRSRIYYNWENEPVPWFFY